MSSERGIIGRCDECGTTFDLSDAPDDFEFYDLRCQALIGHVGGSDQAYVDPLSMPVSLLAVRRTEQGITPVRPCPGRLKTRFTNGLSDHERNE